MKCSRRESRHQQQLHNDIITKGSAIIGSTRVHSKLLVNEDRNVTYRTHPIKIPFKNCEHLPEKKNLPDH